MKKRIISIALALVMIVAMTVDVFAFTFTDEASFDVYVSNNALSVDAEMDDVYRMSEQVSNAYTNYTRGTGTGFDSWTVATKNGLYVYAIVDDTTVGSEYMIYNDNRGATNTVSNGDKIQYYFQFTYSDSTNWWGYFEMDYYANNVDGETMVDDEITAAWGNTYNHVRYKQKAAIGDADTNTIPAGIQYASKILRDSDGAEYGWVAEFFIPFNVAGNVPETQTTLPLTNIGVQVNNDDWRIDEGVTTFKEGWLWRQGYAYSRYVGASSWWTGDLVTYPLTPLNFSDKSFYDYDVYLTSQHVELDGKLDDVYLNSSRIDVVEQWSGNLDGHEVPFYAYVIAGLNGMYVFVDVEDTTMNNINNTEPANGEMVQIYLDWSPKGTAHSDPGVTFDTSKTRGYNSVYGSWMGWFQADYDGNLSGSFDTETQWLKNVGADVAVQKHANPNWDGKTETQYVGYSLEFFVPYNDYMQHIVDTQNFADYHFSFGLQVNDDETYNYNNDKTYKQKVDEEGNPVTDEEGNPVYDTGKPLNADGAEESGWGENRTSIGYTAGGGNYWAHFENLPEMRLVPDANLPRHAAGTTVSSVTLDGANTNGEYDNAQVIHVNLAGSGKGDDGDIYRVICDGEYVYVLMEMVDTTPTYSSTKAGLGYTYHDYNDIYIARYESSDTVLKGSYTSVTRESDTTDIKTVDNGADGWTVEKRYAMTAAEKAAFAKGEFVIGVSMQYLDGTATASGRIYKYDNEQGGVFYGGGGNTYAQGFRKFVFSAGTTAPDLIGASVALGESIGINYYATLATQDTDAKIKFTYNDDEVMYVGAQKTDVDGRYVFPFEKVTPQCMGNNIKAELIVNGKVADKIDEYSVLQNCQNLLALEGDEAISAEAEQLIYDLLAYGAAAQNYKNYKTDNLVNKGYEYDSYEWNGFDSEIVCNDKQVSAANVEGARFTAAGVHYNFVNKIYAKITVTTANVDDLKVTIDGVEAELIKRGNGEYIVYTDAIKVTEFDNVYTIELSDGTNTQTLNYSVNAYAAAKWADSYTDDLNGQLALALYGYGVAAEAYAESLAN